MSCYLYRVFSLAFVLVVYGRLLLIPPHAVVTAAPCYPALFVFGDSVSDTGNGVISGNLLFQRTAQRPYGETVPGTPFKRFSDGLLLVDFLATRLGLPLLNPSLNSSADFSKGVNYAVSGATAQSAADLKIPLKDLSLDEQIGWHLALKASGPSPQKPTIPAYGKGLYVIQIGSNDYGGAISFILFSPSYIITTFIPLVMAKIRNATEVLYANGARNFLYVGITRLGCLPTFLAQFPLKPKDSNGCIHDLNAISYSHGANLLNLTRDLRSIHSDANFTFLDYYGPYTQVIGNSSSYGFSNTLDACCGAGPAFPYRYNIALFCNSLSSTTLSTLCPNPNDFLNWDGLHYTHKFNSLLFNLTINMGSYLDPPNTFMSCIPTNP